MAFDTFGLAIVIEITFLYGSSVDYYLKSFLLIWYDSVKNKNFDYENTIDCIR